MTIGLKDIISDTQFEIKIKNNPFCGLFFINIRLGYVFLIIDSREEFFMIISLTLFWLSFRRGECNPLFL
jgi:hypothetical protein